jgi:hypothetical protein
MTDRWLTFTKTAISLCTHPTAEGIAEAQRRVAENELGDQGLVEMLEWHLCNGWMMIPPEAIGALTSAPIISEDFMLDDYGKYVPVVDDACVYAHMSYAVECPIETWAKGGAVSWVKSATEPAAK